MQSLNDNRTPAALDDAGASSAPHSLARSFDELLRAELAKPAQMKSGGTIQPMEAMVKSVVNNAMKGDLAAIAFIRNMTKDADPEAERRARDQHQQRVEKVACDIATTLGNEKLYDGQTIDIREVAEIKVFVEELTQMMTAPDFQAVTTDMFERFPSIGKAA